MGLNLQDQLAEIKSRADKATEGCWEFTHSVDMRRGSVFVEEKASICSYGPDAMLGKEQSFNNFAFIAHSRTDVPRLLAVIEKLIEQRDQALGSITCSATTCERNMNNFNAELLKILGVE